MVGNGSGVVNGRWNQPHGYCRVGRVPILVRIRYWNEVEGILTMEMDWVKAREGMIPLEVDWVETLENSSTVVEERFEEL